MYVEVQSFKVYSSILTGEGEGEEGRGGHGRRGDARGGEAMGGEARGGEVRQATQGRGGDISQ